MASSRSVTEGIRVERGLYEKLLTRGLERVLDDVGELDRSVEKVDDGDQPHVLARHVQNVLERALASTADPERRVAIVNDLLGTLAASTETVLAPPRQLMIVRTPPAPGVTTYEEVRPATPLSDAALLTNTR